MADETPMAIVEAERWRLAGERLREQSPEVFGRVLVLSHLVLKFDEEEQKDITLSY